MNRYCLTSTLPNFETVVTNHYKDVNVDIVFPDVEEACIAVLDSYDNARVRELNAQIGKMHRVSKPRFVPDYADIDYEHGPFMTGEHYQAVGLKIKDTATGNFYSLTPDEEQAFLLYFDFSGEKDDLFKANFWSSLHSVVGFNPPIAALANIEFQSTRPLPIQAQYSLSSVERHGRAKIDGLPVNLESFSIPPMSLIFRGNDDPDRGRIHHLTRKDILVNSNHPVMGFQTTFKPGAAWAAMYVDPYFKTKHFVLIDFKEPEDDDNDDWAASDLSQDSERSVASQYGSDREEAADAPPRGGVHVETHPDWYDVELQTDISSKDFAGLNAAEKRLLPLAFIPSRPDQYRAILDALSSNFRNTSNLPKVTDAVLMFVADAASTVNHPSDAAMALIEYADARLGPFAQVVMDVVADNQTAERIINEIERTGDIAGSVNGAVLAGMLSAADASVIFANLGSTGSASSLSSDR